jgi:hypothetical protein
LSVFAANPRRIFINIEGSADRDLCGAKWQRIPSPLEHDAEKACPELDPGWEPVFW